MAGILWTGNERRRRPTEGVRQGNESNVHDLFYVRNMFFSVAGDIVLDKPNANAYL